MLDYDNQSFMSSPGTSGCTDSENTNRSHVSRRQMLRTGGAALTAGMASLSGCAGNGAETVDELNLLMEPVLDTEIIEGMISDYEDDQDIEINIETFPYGGLRETSVTQLRADTSEFDLMQIDTAWFGEYVGGDLLRPLDDRIDDSEEISRDVYMDTMVNAVAESDGTMYTLPYYNYAFGQLYRQDLIEDDELSTEYQEEFGSELTFPEDIEDYVELTKFMTRDTNGDGDVDLYGSAMQGQSGIFILDEWLSYFYALGGNYVEDGQVVFSDHIDPAVEAIELYEDQIMNAAPEAAQGWGFNEAIEFMANGNAFTVMTYNWQFQRLTDSPVQDDLAISNVPGDSPIIGAWGLTIPTNVSDARADAAWDFLSWVESPDIRKERASQGAAPTTSDVLNDEELLEQFPDFYPALEDILANGVPLPNMPGANEVNNILGTALNEIVTSDADARERLETAAEEMDAAME